MHVPIGEIDTGGVEGGWVVPGYCGTVRVSMVDTLPQGVAGWTGSPRMSRDGQSYYGVLGNSATEGGWVDG